MWSKSRIPTGHFVSLISVSWHFTNLHTFPTGSVGRKRAMVQPGVELNWYVLLSGTLHQIHLEIGRSRNMKSSTGVHIRKPYTISRIRKKHLCCLLTAVWHIPIFLSVFSQPWRMLAWGKSLLLWKIVTLFHGLINTYSW